MPLFPALGTFASFARNKVSASENMVFDVPEHGARFPRTWFALARTPPRRSVTPSRQPGTWSTMLRNRVATRQNMVFMPAKKVFVHRNTVSLSRNMVTARENSVALPENTVTARRNMVSAPRNMVEDES
jgi:hypothetical protein